MSIFGKLLAAPVRILNAPLVALENLTDPYDGGERVLSRPLDELAKAIQSAVDDEDDDD